MTRSAADASSSPGVAADDLAALDAAQFAIHCADTLAGTLNLRRTLNCAARLAVPRFGAWAGIAIGDANLMRRVDTAGTDEFAPAVRSRPLRDLDADALAVWHAAVTARAVHHAPVDAPVLAAFGVPPGVAEQLAAPEGVLVTMPLTGAVLGRAVLAIVAVTEPDPDELADFTRRVSRAVAAAAVYEERATLARTLREALAPAPLPAIAGVQLGASYRAAQEASQIGGDFYDVTPRPDGSWAVSIGDVCGKGVDAAVLTGQVRQSLRTASFVGDDPAAALQLVNDTLVGNDGSTFVTAAYALLAATADRVRMRIAAGGHPPPLLLHAGEVTPLDVRGTLIGMLPDVSFHTVEVDLEPADVLLFYTDGAPEARGPNGLLGMDPITAVLADSANLTAQAVTERVMQLVMEHLHGWAHDDIALLAVRRGGADGR